MTDTHLTAPTRFVEVGGTRFAYRRWGNGAASQPPMLFLQHFRGGMDHWDPLMTDGLAAGREVILYNGRGIASSGGTPRTRIEDMADDAAAFVRAFGLEQIDVLGFSLGGFQALDLTWRHPELVRKLMLLGTGPRGGNPELEERVLTTAVNPIPTFEDFRYCSSAGRIRLNRLLGRSGSGVTSGWIRTRRLRRRWPTPRSRPTCCTCPG